MSEILWTSADAAKATGGKAVGEWGATSVSIDSRTLAPGALYVALKGDNADGHAFVADAFKRGAVAALVSVPVENVPAEKLLVVGNTLNAFTAMGRAARKRSKAKIIGVTGSIGKTTTKEMLALMCSNFGKTYATKGNLNNHFGVPLMLANMPLDTEFGVFEMGMNHTGEIAALAKIVEPHVAIITTIEAVHLEFFESVADIADTKSEIFNGITVDAVAILNHDNAHFGRCKKQAELFHPKRIISFGRHEDANVQLQLQAETETGVALTVHAGNKHITYTIDASGEGPVVASLIAIAVADGLKLDVERAAKSLAGFREVEGRGRMQEVVFEGKQMWWMDDSYNAGPASMAASFKKLASIAKRTQGVKRSVAVIGDMLELGVDAQKFHSELAEKLQAEHIGVVYAAGALAKYCFDALPKSMQGQHVAQAADLVPILRAELQAGDAVLFKGSHGSKIYALVEKLQPAKTNP